jgi:hypothetical protein
MLAITMELEWLVGRYFEVADEQFRLMGELNLTVKTTESKK